MDSETVLARLRESHGLRLVDPVTLSQGRARVLRCRATSEADHRSVIVKIADPETITFRRELAAYRDIRMKASEEEIAQALEGNWQDDQLFVLQQERAGYEFCQKQMAECDRQLAHYLGQIQDRSQGATLPTETRKERRKKKKAILHSLTCGKICFA